MKDATGQALAYVYARETRADADTAKVLTMDEGFEQYCQAARAAEQERQALMASASAGALFSLPLLVQAL